MLYIMNMYRMIFYCHRTIVLSIVLGCLTPHGWVQKGRRYTETGRDFSELGHDGRR